MKEEFKEFKEDINYQKYLKLKKEGDFPEATIFLIVDGELIDTGNDIEELMKRGDIYTAEKGITSGALIQPLEKKEKVFKSRSPRIIK